MRQDFYHIEPIPRRFPHGFEVSSIGYISKKRYRITTEFDSCNFSFILSGSGWYETKAGRVSVQAPCVITQMPGIPVDYSPEPHWEELFLIYDARYLPVIEKRLFYDRSRPLWQIPAEAGVEDVTRLLLQRLNAPREHADSIDSLCEQLIKSSRSELSLEGTGELSVQAREILELFDNHIDQQESIERLCERFNINPAALRRQFQAAFGKSPVTYRLDRRIEEAKRLLAESSLSARQIALECGFSEELYFYRAFRSRTGFTSSEYRRIHRDPLRLTQL